MKYINLTVHKATPDQVAAGVVDLPEEQIAQLKKLSTFDSIPRAGEIEERIVEIIDMLLDLGYLKADAPATASISELEKLEEEKDAVAFMVGGALFFYPHLVNAIWKDFGQKSFLAFTKRQAVEQVNEDGTVTKTAIFKHDGFVLADWVFD